jgi:hypothetical protein
MNSPLSNDQINDALHIDSSYIIKYSDLDNYSSLADLFGAKNFIILLIEQEVNSGHWVTFYRTDDNTYVYFNSFGKKYDSDLTLISRLSNKILGNEYNSIKKLIQPTDKVEWNKIKYQGNKSSVCGRYVIFFVRCMREGKTLKEIQNILKEHKKEKGFASFDECILNLTSDV